MCCGSLAYIYNKQRGTINKRVVKKLGKKTPVSQIPLFLIQVMNEIKNKFLMAGDTFMHNMHLRQPIFMFRTCGTRTKNKGQTKNVKKQGILLIFI